MNKKPWILLRNSFKDRGQITLLYKKAVEDSQDLTAAPATETPRRKLDAVTRQGVLRQYLKSSGWFNISFKSQPLNYVFCDILKTVSGSQA